MRRWVYLLGAVFIAACAGDSPIDPSTPGTIMGTVTADDGTTPVASASVFLQANPAATTTSDVNGSYSIEQVAPGAHVVVAVKGNFRSETPVTVQAGKTVSAPAKLKPVGKLGYVSGSFDSIEDILTQLGYTPESVDHSALTSASALAQYKMIFLNCGAGVSTDAAATLKAWVQAGGTLYASDWELDVVQAMFPTDILEIGSGDGDQTVTASITNTALQQFTGKATASIFYDLGAWKMLSAISATPTVLLRGTVSGYTDSSEDTSFPNQPLAISISHGTGRVVYTTFHNESGVTADQLAVLRYFIFY